MPHSVLTYTEAVNIATSALRRLIKPSVLRAMQQRAAPSITAASIPQQRMASVATGSGAANNSFVPGQAPATPVISYTRSVSHNSTNMPPRLRRQPMPLTREQIILGTDSQATAPHPQLRALKQQ